MRFIRSDKPDQSWCCAQTLTHFLMGSGSQRGGRSLQRSPDHSLMCFLQVLLGSGPDFGPRPFQSLAQTNKVNLFICKQVLFLFVFNKRRNKQFLDNKYIKRTLRLSWTRTGIWVKTWTRIWSRWAHRAALTLHLNLIIHSLCEPPPSDKKTPRAVRRRHAALETHLVPGDREDTQEPEAGDHQTPSETS